MTTSPTRPTNQPSDQPSVAQFMIAPPKGEDEPDVPVDSLMKYYSLRITAPHVEWPQVQECINDYSRTYISCLHAADHEVPHEHFHIFFLDLTPVKVEAMRKRLKTVFKRQGNGFFAGKFMDNHIYKGLQYVKHDPSVSYKRRGSGWEDRLAAAPAWEDKTSDHSSVSRKRVLERDPLITYSNILWLARKYRSDNQLTSTDLGVILNHMCRCTHYQPSVDILRRGLDPWHFKQFEYKCHDSVGKCPDWWTPRIEASHEARYRPSS